MAYVALLVYVAVLFVRPQEWVPFLLGVHIMYIVVGFAIATWMGSLLGSDWKLKDAPQNGLMLGLFFAALMSQVAHTYLAKLISTFQDFGKVVIAYFLLASLVNSVKRARAIIVVMVLGCLFLTTHALLQHYRGYGFGGDYQQFRPVIEQGVMRVQGLGIFHDPNDLALMLVSILPFLLLGVLGKTSNLPVRVLSLAACVPIVYVIFLTNSRGGWLAFGVMILAFLYTRMRNKKLALIVAGVAFAGLLAVGPSRMGLLNASDNSAHERLILWGDGNRMLKANPLFGVGKNRFQEFSSNGQVAHNSFVHCWAELGLFGYFFWLGLVLACLKDGWALNEVSRQLREQEAADPERELTDDEEVRRREALQLSELGRATFSSLVGYLAAAMFLSRTYILVLYILFALVAAMRVVYQKDVGPLRNAAVGKDWKYLVAAELASVPALYVFIRLMH